MKYAFALLASVAAVSALESLPVVGGLEGALGGKKDAQPNPKFIGGGSSSASHYSSLALPERSEVPVAKSTQPKSGLPVDLPLKRSYAPGADSYGAADSYPAADSYGSAGSAPAQEKKPSSSVVAHPAPTAAPKWAPEEEAEECVPVTVTVTASKKGWTNNSTESSNAWVPAPNAGGYAAPTGAAQAATTTAPPKAYYSNAANSLTGGAVAAAGVFAAMFL